MGFSPDIIELLTDDPQTPDVRDDPQAAEIGAANAGFLHRLMMMTGHGVIPGVPDKPVFKAERPTAEQRAERRRRRREARDAGGNEAGEPKE